MSTSTISRAQTISLVIIASILGAAALRELKPVMIPFVLAILLTYTLEPVVTLFVERCRFPRWAGVISAIILGFLAVTAVADLVTSAVTELAQNADIYQSRLSKLSGQIVDRLQSLGIPFEAKAIQENIPLGRTVAQLGEAILSLGSNTFLVIIFAIYLLQGSTTPTTSEGLRGEIEGRIKNYLFMKAVLSLGTGFLTGLILWALGIQSAVVFGLLAFILNFIPSVGSVVAVLLPLPLALFDPSATGMTIALVIILPTIVQIVIGNVLEPKWMGDSLQLHPITILMGLVFWGMIWGIPGMLLATPICAALRIIFDSFEDTKPLARLLAGRLEDPEDSITLDIEESPEGAEV